MKYPKYPCRGCVYFKECGSDTRTEFCAGRSTKRQIKEMERMGYPLTILHTNSIELQNVGVNEFFCPCKEAIPENVYLRCGKGDGKEIPCYDNIGMPYLVDEIHRQVYLVPRETALKIWNWGNNQTK